MTQSFIAEAVISLSFALLPLSEHPQKQAIYIYIYIYIIFFELISDGAGWRVH